MGLRPYLPRKYHSLRARKRRHHSTISILKYLATIDTRTLTCTRKNVSEYYNKISTKCTAIPASITMAIARGEDSRLGSWFGRHHKSGLADGLAEFLPLGQPRVSLPGRLHGPDLLLPPHELVWLHH